MFCLFNLVRAKQCGMAWASLVVVTWLARLMCVGMCARVLVCVHVLLAQFGHKDCDFDGPGSGIRTAAVLTFTQTCQTQLIAPGSTDRLIVRACILVHGGLKFPCNCNKTIHKISCKIVMECCLISFGSQELHLHSEWLPYHAIFYTSSSDWTPFTSYTSLILNPVYFLMFLFLCFDRLLFLDLPLIT